MAILQSTTISGTGYLQLPVGRTADRPTAPAYTVVQFTSTGTSNWTVPANVYRVDVLVVGGGGGGGAWVGGGGGAGGVVYREGYAVTPGQSISYTVGVGGTGEYNPGSYGGMPRATNGGQSAFGSITALGGGYGGSWSSFPASSGASGGGNGYNYAGAAGTPGQGFPGGQGRGDGTNGYPTGGGGGAGGPGGSWRIGGSGEITTGSWGPNGKSGDGGPGLAYDISGTLTFYGGGGGGGIHGASSDARPGFGGMGGGGDGNGPSTTLASYQNARANTGGGGGGGGYSGGSPSYGGAGGSGVVIVRYATAGGINAELKPGAVRLNTQRGLEYYDSTGRWANLSVPFHSRTIITTGYQSGGYKDGSAWNNVNKIQAATDVTYNLGDGSLARSMNYQSGACGQNIGWVFGAGNGHAVSSNYVQGFNMRTEQAYNPGNINMANNRINSGTIFQEHYFAWTTGGGAAAVEEFNMMVATSHTSASGGWSATNQWGMSHENYGIFYWEEDSRIWHFAARTATSTFGGQPSAYHQQKSVQSKYSNCYAGNEGSYNGGNNLRRSNMYTRTTSGTVAKPVTNNGEENFTMGQDWQYLLGEYNGAQNNNAWKFYYSTETGYSGGSDMQPKGHAGSSSGTCFWRN